jgi:hypothetical protein
LWLWLSPSHSHNRSHNLISGCVCGLSWAFFSLCISVFGRPCVDVIDREHFELMYRHQHKFAIHFYVVSMPQALGEFIDNDIDRVLRPATIDLQDRAHCRARAVATFGRHRFASHILLHERLATTNYWWIPCFFL